MGYLEKKYIIAYDVKNLKFPVMGFITNKDRIKMLVAFLSDVDAVEYHIKGFEDGKILVVTRESIIRGLENPIPISSNLVERFNYLKNADLSKATYEMVKPLREDK